MAGPSNRRSRFSKLFTTCLIILESTTQVQSACSNALKPSYPAPIMAQGYKAELIKKGLNFPRDIIFDSEGALLVAQYGGGVVALTLDASDDGCVSVTKTKTVVSDSSLDHGIELSPDGNTLYASSSDKVFSWTYSPEMQKVTSESTTLVTNMKNSDHSTRTLLLSQKVPGLMVVSRGSASNQDPESKNIKSGHAQVKAFNLRNMTDAYDFDTDGLLLGWGLRNDVGVDEHPTTGGIFTVENSVDQMHRNGKDIHQTNPAEEMNFLGYLDGTESPNQGRNFGYPECYTAWDPSTIPDYDGEVGQQFLIGSDVDAKMDKADCSNVVVQQAVLPFHPHMAPLDILFNTKGTAAWVTFHGSWDSTPPVGYKLSVVEFKDGAPIESSTSTTAAIDIMVNADVTTCYNDDCFRPVGLAWDKKGRLFMSSDQTGEIYVITRTHGEPVSAASSFSKQHQAVSGSGGGSGNDGSRLQAAGCMGILIFLALVLLLA